LINLPKIDFTPTKNGLHFPNNFINNVANIPGYGEIVTRGRCGGMAYATLDYYYARIAIPDYKESYFPYPEFNPEGVPPDANTLANYIYARLINSFEVPSAIKYISLTLAPDHSTWLSKGVTRWTKEDEFPKIQKSIDGGKPVVLGLIYANNINDVGQNHQVVAYGYDYDPNAKRITVYVYDNNYPDLEVIFSTDPSNPHVNASTGEIWRGFFVHDYISNAPPQIRVPSKSWVKSLYVDLLHRIPAQTEVDSWFYSLMRNASLDSVADGFIRSQEYCTITANSFYVQFLDRQGDPAGIDGWVSILMKGTSMQDIIVGFCDSAEYKQKHPVPNEFVRSLYLKLLGREPEPGAVENSPIHSGMSTANVIRGFLVSEEYATKVCDGYYSTFLARSPDEQGLRGWANLIEHGLSLQQIIKGFITSDEYISRSVSR
jgi:hypothetical protein